MIAACTPEGGVAEGLFEEALQVITASGAAGMIEAAAAARRGPGGRPPTGVRYTVLAVLVAVYLRITRRQPVNLASIARLLVQDFSDAQLTAVGMSLTADQRTLLQTPHGARCEYARFHGWLQREFAVLDSNPDIPARRTRVSERRTMIEGRTSEQCASIAASHELLDSVMNAIVAASIDDKLPLDYRGDIVIDESTFDTSKLGSGQGTKDNQKTPAAPAAGVYARGRGVIIDRQGKRAQAIQKSGCGIAVTAVIRVSEPGRKVTFPPLTTAIAAAPPRSANLEATRRALHHHTASGFDPKRSLSPNSRRPRVTTDMGYTALRGWASLMRERGFDPVMRYPTGWRLTSPAAPPGDAPTPEHPGGPGPILIEGSWHCPAVQAITSRRLAVRLRDIKDTRAHDQLVRARLSHLMGLNGHPVEARRRGRPRRGETPQTHLTVALVCPAGQGRVRCPHRPDSMTLDARDHYTVNPEFPADAYECCSRNQISVRMTAKQARLYQRALPAGSWEHTLWYEELRALNERIFAYTKSPHITNLHNLVIGPRREPIQMIALATAFAVTNRAIQRNFRPYESTYNANWAKLEANIGAPPTRIPNLS